MELSELLERDELTEEESVQLFNGIFDLIWMGLLPQQIDIEGLPARVSSNVITETDVPVPDCTECGACCTAFARVPAEDGSGANDEDCWKVTKELPAGRVVTDRFIKRKPDSMHCSELEGELGVNVGCRIYDSRPITCRTFEAGSDRCHAIRRAYGIEPYLTLEEMAIAGERLEARNGAGSAQMIESVVYSSSDEGSQVRITARLTDGSDALLHEYDPNEEVWYRSEIEGFSMEDFRKLRANKLRARV